jgi:hypothetical protein
MLSLSSSHGLGRLRSNLASLRVVRKPRHDKSDAATAMSMTADSHEAVRTHHCSRRPRTAVDFGSVLVNDRYRPERIGAAGTLRGCLSDICIENEDALQPV